jgi:hypothetical protein
MKKMTLVEKAVLDRLREKQITAAIATPELSTMVKIQAQIEDILQNAQMSNEEKLSMLRRAEEKYDKIKESLHPAALQTATTTRTAPPAATSEAAVGTDAPSTVEAGYGPEAESIYKDITFAPSIQPKFGKFQEFLAKHPNLIKKNAKDEILIKNKRIPDSNFTHLMRHLYHPQEGQNLTGLPHLIHALKSVDLPQDLISNKSIRENWSGESRALALPSPSSHAPPPKEKSQTGQGKPPGKRPRVLRLYR